MIEIKKFEFSNTELMKIAHKIRYEVFVIGQNCPSDLEYESEEESTHFLLTNKKKPVATSRYRKTNKGYKLERFAVIKSQRFKGYGKIILNAMLEDLKNKEHKYLHSQKQVTEFYRKAGFKKVGNVFEEAGIMHYKMIFNNKI